MDHRWYHAGARRPRYGGRDFRQDKYTLKVPGGLAFSEFKGYESWEVISISQNGTALPLFSAIPP